METPTERFIVGIDISQDHLDVHILPTNEKLNVAYDENGLETLINRMKEINPNIIAMEATGSLERVLVGYYADNELPFAVINPRFIKHFGIGIGRRAKTDPLDAELIALYAQATSPEPMMVPDETRQELGELVARRRQLKKMRTAELNRYKRASSTAVRRSVQVIIHLLEQQIEDVDRQIGQIINGSPHLKKQDELLQSFKGIGPVNARALIADMPELGCIGRGEIASLLGVAPFNKDSGKRKGKRSIQGGRFQMRRELYMAAIAAIRHNPVIRDFHQRLVQSGKVEKVAITACMRKIIVILNAMVRSQTHWVCPIG